MLHSCRFTSILTISCSLLVTLVGPLTWCFEVTKEHDDGIWTMHSGPTHNIGSDHFFFTFLYSGHLKGLNFLKQGKKSPYVLWLLVKLGPKSDKLIFSKAFRRFGPRESNCSRAPKYWWIIKPTLDTTVKMSEKFKNGVKKNIQGVLRVTKADFTHWIRS